MKKSKKKLIGFYESLPDVAAQQLLDFAEFLASRHQVEIKEIGPPEDITRPEKESVVIAVKRLSATYPMINKDKLLNETASLVTQHLIQGRDAIEVIDELENLFKQQYAVMLDEIKQDTPE